MSGNTIVVKGLAGLRPRVRALAGALLMLASMVVVGAPASANALREGIAAFNREDYVRAAFLLRPLGENGNPHAQTYLGFMYYYGRGVPQNYEESVRFYGNAAESGVPLAQYQYGLMFDKGLGVPQDYVLAYVWTNRAVAAAPKRVREPWARVRDAIRNKLTLAQKTLAQRLSIGSPVVNTSRETLWSFEHLY